MLNLLVRKENHGIEPHGDKGRRKEADAYFTVEAAVIVPSVLFLFVMIIYLFIYMTDAL